MPIILNDPSQVVITMLPKTFFSNVLTGTGGKTGLITEYRNPIYTAPTLETKTRNVYVTKRKVKNGDTTTEYIPFNILTADAWSQLKTIPKPDCKSLPYIAKKTEKNNNISVYFEMKPHTAIYEETPLKNQTGNKRSLVVCYQMFLYYIRSSNAECKVNDYFVPQLYSGKTNVVTYKYSCTPYQAMQETINHLANNGYDVDATKILEYFESYSLYDALCERTHEWCNDIDKVLDNYFKNIKHNTGYASLHEPKDVLTNLEKHNVPLERYKNIYKSINTHFTNPDVVQELCKHNLNLLLSETLNNLSNKKNLLTHIPNVPHAVTTNNTNIVKFSAEQLKAITSDEPLILVQAGAGTGKSTVILGRINHMVSAGIDPHDIMVLSFTNAAADHIKELNSEVGSMTIASMIHTIYEKNFPTHKLSNTDTVINCLDIYYPNDSFASEFKNHLIGLKKTSDKSNFTKMNNFVEKNYDKVETILNKIEQTTLELEIIIAYQKIDTLSEPDEIKSKYLIVDEVQDNSIFEFVYTLKYVNKHNESLFIVGDCSQTLYEFRASNPRALNVMEGSGVFATYQLQINYRSNQEILDFANVLLSTITANDYAGIQLKANSLAAITDKSFKEKVQIYYQRLAKQSDLRNALSTIVAQNMEPFVTDKLKKGEKVCFLSYKRDDVKLVGEALQRIYPDKKIVNIISERANEFDIFTSFINYYWDEIKVAPYNEIITIITRQIKAHLPDLVGRASAVDKCKDLVKKLLNSWYEENKDQFNMWTQMYANKQLSHDDLLVNIRETLIEHEREYNNTKMQRLTMINNQRRQEESMKDANIILSTIHGAKGLEFENTIVLMKDDKYLPEDMKRLYYVALTRAMKAELIIAYGLTKTSKVETDHKLVIDGLSKKQKLVKTNVAVNVAADAANVATDVAADDCDNENSDNSSSEN